MLLTTGVIEESLKGYSNTRCKLGRLVRDGTYHPVIRNLYETDPDVPGYLLANHVCSPSYISYEWALSFHDLIPEHVPNVTSATFNKRRNKVFETPFGNFLYSDVPGSVFTFGVERLVQEDRPFWIATPEKAVCDRLYKMPPAGDLGELQCLLYDDLRMDEDEIAGLRSRDVRFLVERYRCRNVTLFGRLLE